MKDLLLLAAIVGGAYYVATRTCTGKALVARVLGRPAEDCGCGCTGASKQPAVAADIVRTAARVADEFDDRLGFGGAPVTGAEPTDFAFTARGGCA